MVKNKISVDDVNKLQKIKSKMTSDIYYTSSSWKKKEVDGVVFVPVVKKRPDGTNSKTILWIRKDSTEYVN